MALSEAPQFRQEQVDSPKFNNRGALEDVHAQLVVAIEKLTTSDNWLRFLAASSRFHRYSVNNVLLIVAQAHEHVGAASRTGALAVLRLKAAAPHERACLGASNLY